MKGMRVTAKPKDPLTEWGFRIEKEIEGEPGESFLSVLDRFYVILEENGFRDEGDEGDGKA